MNDIGKISIPQLNLAPTVDQYQAVFGDIEERQKNALRVVEVANREKARQEKENRDNIKRIADNSQDTVNALKETNELLRKNNELLERENEGLYRKLDEISNVLKNLFELEEIKGDEQKALLREAVALAVEIDMSINENGKFDWKSLLTNTTTTGLFMGLQVYLHNKGLL